MENKRYKVLWTSYARVALAKMQPYQITVMNIFGHTKAILSSELDYKAYGISDFPRFSFNGYSGPLIGNVVILYTRSTLMLAILQIKNHLIIFSVELILMKNKKCQEKCSSIAHFLGTSFLYYS